MHEVYNLNYRSEKTNGFPGFDGGNRTERCCAYWWWNQGGSWHHYVWGKTKSDIRRLINRPAFETWNNHGEHIQACSRHHHYYHHHGRCHKTDKHFPTFRNIVLPSSSGKSSAIFQPKGCLKAKNFAKSKSNCLGLCSHSCLPNASLGYRAAIL